MINGAPISATGRVAVDTGVTVPGTSNGGLSYAADGALCVTTLNGAATSWNGGFAFVGKRLKARDIADGPFPGVINWNQGLPIYVLTDELICSTTTPPVQWNHGWPQDANGAVCIGEGAPVVNAFTEGFDTGFD